jgi:quercetin dioxygenase-like cupin family protein
MNTRAVIVALLAVLVIPTAAACGSSENATSATPTTTTTTTAAPATVVRDVLDNDLTPPGAPDSTLSLVRYTIPAGAKLARHVHPGVQMASIESGTLTYTVMSGTAQVRRAGATTDTPTTGLTTIELGRGDAVTEAGNMVHFGYNKANAPVVILATLLTAHGHELAEPVPAR